MRLQSQEGQELSAAAGGCQYIVKITSEHQTVDHKTEAHWNRLRHELCSICHSMQHSMTQTFANSAQNADGFAQSSD